MKCVGDGRIRPKHVVIFPSSINIVRYTCCVIDCTHIPIIHTHNGDGTFQNYSVSKCVCVCVYIYSIYMYIYIK